MTRRSTLAIEIEAFPESNDHKVSLRVDGVNLLEEQLQGVGLDPDDFFFPAPRILSMGQVAIGRCTCGVVGCGDVFVEIREEHPFIYWDLLSGEVRFVAEQYQSEIARAAADTSWETADRTAARLVRSELGRVGALLSSRGMAYQWASGRAAPGSFTLSLRDSGGEQRLVSRRWKGETPEAIADAVLSELERFLLSLPVQS